MKCSFCDNQAIISQRYSGAHLCEGHFMEGFERKVEDTMLRGNMVEERDKIAVAVSGGKDSTALLLVLKKILEGKRVEMVAITVDEGIAGYRDDTVKAARSICERLEVEHRIISFRKEFGFDLDEVVSGKIAAGRDAAPCTFCGVFRKSALNRAAKLLGATRVATGHNLDDEAQSIMMNYLKGDIERLLRFRPRREQPGLVPRIKPLREIPEKETALYCMVNGAFTESRECPYARLSFRADVRDVMNRLESLFPGMRQSTLQGFERIAGMTRGRVGIDLGKCRECGEPCVGDLCKACELLGRLKL